MLVNELCQICHTTKKAVAYYEGQGLLHPQCLENGYRDFSDKEAKTLRRITLLRRLDLSLAEIKEILAAPDPRELLLQCVSQKEEKMRQLTDQCDALRALAQQGLDAPDVLRAFEASLENASTLRERLRQAFPGGYGLFISTHFGRFLDVQVDTPVKRAAYDRILSFLDTVEETPLPQEVQDQISVLYDAMDERKASEMDDAMIHHVENMDRYLEENHAALEDYLALRTSPAYKETPAYALQQALLDFQRTTGYARFLEDLQLLSPAYREYRGLLRQAEDKLYRHFPAARALYE